MNKDDIRHLATLSRLEVTDEDLDTYSKQIPEILEYVKKIESFDTKDSKENFEQNNVFRSDEEVSESGIDTEKLLAEAPESKDGFIKVKKVL